MTSTPIYPEVAVLLEGVGPAEGDCQPGTIDPASPSSSQMSVAAQVEVNCLAHFSLPCSFVSLELGLLAPAVTTAVSSERSSPLCLEDSVS